MELFLLASISKIADNLLQNLSKKIKTILLMKFVSINRHIIPRELLKVMSGAIKKEVSVLVVLGDGVFLVMELLGHSLSNLFIFCEETFDEATIFNVAIQMITRLQSVHKLGFLHRDVKPENFTIGRQGRQHIIYIIDFGEAKRFINAQTGKHIPFSNCAKISGTTKYMARNAHFRHQQGRKDDLQSLGYVLLFFKLGKLPWDVLTSKKFNNVNQLHEAYGKFKQQIPIQTLCQPCGPSAKIFVSFFSYVLGLGYEDQPNYYFLISIFIKELERVNCTQNDLIWIKNPYMVTER